jgi:hypothetical protein
MKKYQVEITLATLHETAMHPPRKRLWDRIPSWLGMFILRWFSPKPTPYEVWAVNSVALRSYYARFYAMMSLMNQQSLLGEHPEPAAEPVEPVEDDGRTWN